MNQRCDIAVVGAGPAGQAAAIAAGRAGRRVIVLERMQSPALKLLASGGGRCNVTRDEPAGDVMAQLGPQGRFAAEALRLMGPGELRQWLSELGVPTRVEGVGVYPASNKASDVQDALGAELARLGASIQTGAEVTGLEITDGRARGVRLASGECVEASAVVLACGGRGWPALGGSDLGYVLARQAGHRIVVPTPALVALETAEDWPWRLAGVSLPDAAVRVERRGEPKEPTCGGVLFTHRGVSGPAVLDISGRVGQLLAQDGQPVTLRLRLTGEGDAAAWSRRFQQWRSGSGARQVRSLLAAEVPAALAEVLCELAGAGAAQQASQLSAPQSRSLAELLTALPLTVSATEGFARAMATRGGVALKEVDPRTLASRLVGGLSFAGELLDLDGPCGGFNLTWAFASGTLAGLSAAEALASSGS
jgi:predicted Rossmann fold flavoprotein